MKRNQLNIEEVLHSFPSASNEKVESARKRILNNVLSNAGAEHDAEQDEPAVDFHSRHDVNGWSAASLATVAAVLVVAVWVGVVLQRGDTYAVLQTADGGLY